MIRYHVLGKPGRDNAVLAIVDSGKSVTRFLFDCGMGCLDSLPLGEVMAIDAAFFSHYHMDHISGLDGLIRCNYNRDVNPLWLIGPDESRRVLQHRLQAYTWNLIENATGSVKISEFNDGRLTTYEFATRQAFRQPHNEERSEFRDVVFTSPTVSVHAIELNHGCISAGYRLNEADSLNVNTEALSQLDLKPGPWLTRIKDTVGTRSSETIELQGRTYSVGELRDNLLTIRKGASLAYLTDFRPTIEQRERLLPFINGVDTLICEASYASEDIELAKHNHHLCAHEAADLALEANASELVMIHLSDRYTRGQWNEQLAAAQCCFSRALAARMASMDVVGSNGFNARVRFLTFT